MLVPTVAGAQVTLLYQPVHQPLALTQGESPGCSNVPPEPEKSPARLGGGIQGGGRTYHETNPRIGSNVQHKAGPLGRPGAGAEGLGRLVRGKRTKVEPQASHEPAGVTADEGSQEVEQPGVAAGDEHQVVDLPKLEKVNILDKMMAGTGAVRKKLVAGKTKGKKTPVRKNKKKKEEIKEDLSGMTEMRNLMRSWSSKKRSRKELEEGDEEVEPLPGTSDEHAPVVDVVESDKVTVVDDGNVVVDNRETLVERVRKKFDNPFSSSSRDPNLDFDSWKLRREEQRRNRELAGHAGHVQREEGVLGVGDDKDHKRIKLDSVPETGRNLKCKSIINQKCSSLLGGNQAGVQCDEGVQGGDGGRVRPVQLGSDRQRATGVERTFLRSDDLSNGAAAATLGEKLVLMGKATVQNTARNNF